MSKAKQFQVIAKESIGGRITQGNIYDVYNVSFTKLNPEGLFLIYANNDSFHRVSSSYFKPINRQER